MQDRRGRPGLAHDASLLRRNLRPLGYSSTTAPTSKYRRTPAHTAVRTVIYLEEHKHPGPDLHSDIRVFWQHVIEIPAVLLILLQHYKTQRISVQARVSISVPKMLDAKAPVNSCSLYSLASLHYAADLGSRKAVELLLQWDVEVTAGTATGYTPLDYAVRQGYYAVVGLLVKGGAELTVCGEYIARRRLRGRRSCLQ